MSSSISAPNPCLVAVLLVCQTRSGSGPQLVFHWPPDPLDNHDRSNSGVDSQDTLIYSDDSERWSSEDDDYGIDSYTSIRAVGDVNGQSNSNASRQSRNAAKPASTSNGHASVKSTIFDLDEDGLVGLLAPDRTWHKRKFELNINDLTFVGRPVFAKHDGSWQRRKKSRLAKQRAVSPHAEQSTEEEETEPDRENDKHEPQDPSSSIKSELTMFHVVFVMSPPPLDHTRRVKEMYDNVVKKLSRALRLVQAHHDYVWQQADLLLSKRYQYKAETETSETELLQQLAQASSLAKAIVTVYNAISASKIASVPLLPGFQLALQIPPVTSTAYLPSLTEPPIPPGLWLTTATEPPSSTDTSHKHAASTVLQLAKSYTLLLKSAPQKIARDAHAAGGPLADHLPRFVAALRPTKSFWKLSNEHHISLADIQLLARHLIYWRRAVAIPPLHQRDTYIVSPNADFHKLREACKSYEAQFPSSLPSLPKLLSVLSGIPRPFGTLIPSPDHKETYMFLLAWLLRNGLVTQLRTFAYVRVGSDIKKLATERDRESKASISQSLNSNGDIPSSTTENAGPQRPSFASRQSSDGRQSFRDSKTLKAASLIKSPARASPEESRWLNCLHASILDDHGVFAEMSTAERQELYHYWPVFSKHFDGITALESVAIREGLKRQIIWNLLGKMGLSFDRGVEDEQGENTAMMVTVRHW